MVLLLINPDASALVAVAIAVVIMLGLVAWLLYDIRRRLGEIHGVATENLKRVVEELRIAHEKLAGMEITVVTSNMQTMALELERLRDTVSRLTEAMSPYIKLDDLKSHG
jgi:hypothetical protein